MTAFPPQNFAKYRWTSVPSDPALFQRYAAGTELFTDFEYRNLDGQHSMKLGIDVSFGTVLAPTRLLHFARAAWTTLRYEVPTVAAWTNLDAAGDTLIQYRIASGTSEVQDWAERTVQLIEGVSTEEATNQVLDRVIPPSSHDQSTLHIASRTPTEYLFILSTIHTLFDGSGHKAVAHRFLSTLARYVGDEGLAEHDLTMLQWGNESGHLLPSYTDVHVESEPRQGSVYDQTLGGIMHDFATALPRAHPYIRQPSLNGLTTSRRIEHRFTSEQTSRIVQYAKSKGFTINQMVHAAIFLSALHDNPAVAEGAVFACFSAINVRDRLQAPLNARHAFPGSCIAGSAVIVPVSVAQGLEGSAQLDAVASVIKQEYARQKVYPALLTTSAQMVDILLAAVKTNPPLPRNAPAYVGDGIGEHHLDQGYKDDAGTETIQIATFWYSVRQVEPGQNFRAYSWRDELIISVDFNEGATPRRAVESHLRDIVQALTL